ncbi:hypothetical protein NliqN6_3375 [Naganishia liquefaciens]|uniref:Phospholipid/glycerol acyltransferase domain-containing protein n=1 Tax=Naganishia liquefaciens TaxID=104408 RepID=A0A8H3TU70_9TREE|nr:hypothetical protein NliqN6_3375 [Naganishia liquefaciens]
MEKYSKWRDPGTGIQPFLPPVPATSESPLLVLYKAVAGFASISRCAVLLVVALVYAVLVDIPERVLGPALSRRITRIPSAALCRLALFLMGYWWIGTEVAQVKRVREKIPVKVEVKAGDLIVANWTGYIEVLYLAFRYQPTFLLPIHEEAPASTADTSESITTHTKFLGYKPVRLSTLLSLTAHTPTTFRTRLAGTITYPSIAHARSSLPGAPLVVFPEGTTSNARGLLKFSKGCLADVKVPVITYNVWIMFFKHPPPTVYTPTSTHTVPTPRFNPFPHMFTTQCASLLPRNLTCRILHPSNSPSSGSFLPSETLNLNSLTGNDTHENVLGGCCGVLMCQLGRFKHVGLGWEDKEAFLKFFKSRKGAGSGTSGGRAMGGEGRRGGPGKARTGR